VKLEVGAVVGIDRHRDTRREPSRTRRRDRGGDSRSVAHAKGRVLPGQHLDPDAHLAFAARFGPPTEGHPVIPGIPGYPNIFEIDYTKAREPNATYGDVVSRRQGIDWHTDVTFVKRPPLGSILNAKVTHLPAGIRCGPTKAPLSRTSARPCSRIYRRCTPSRRPRAFKNILERVGKGSWDGKEFVELEPVVHPIVRTHPRPARRFSSSIRDSLHTSSNSTVARAMPC